jgi:hypothetical protein
MTSTKNILLQVHDLEKKLREKYPVLVEAETLLDRRDELALELWRQGKARRMGVNEENLRWLHDPRAIPPKGTHYWLEQSGENLYELPSWHWQEELVRLEKSERQKGSQGQNLRGPCQDFLVQGSRLGDLLAQLDPRGENLAEVTWTVMEQVTGPGNVYEEEKIFRLSYIGALKSLGSNLCELLAPLPPGLFSLLEKVTSQSFWESLLEGNADLVCTPPQI